MTRFLQLVKRIYDIVHNNLGVVAFVVVAGLVYCWWRSADYAVTYLHYPPVIGWLMALFIEMMAFSSVILIVIGLVEGYKQALFGTQKWFYRGITLLGFLAATLSGGINTFVAYHDAFEITKNDGWSITMAGVQLVLLLFVFGYSMHGIASERDRIRQEHIVAECERLRKLEQEQELIKELALEQEMRAKGKKRCTVCRKWITRNNHAKHERKCTG